MKKNILLLSCICSIIATQNISAKKDLSIKKLELTAQIDSLDNELIQKSAFQEENKFMTVEELNQKLNTLSNQLDKILVKVKNKKDKKVLVQLIQNVQKADSSYKDKKSAHQAKENKNNSSLRKDTFDVLKSLTTQTAIIAYAAIVCFAITKKMLDTGEISRILNEFKQILDRVITIEKLKLVGQSVTYILQGLLYYVGLGSFGTIAKGASLGI